MQTEVLRATCVDDLQILRRVALVRTDALEQCITSVIKVARLGELLTTLEVKNGVFWDVTPCGSCKSRCFGGI
jgi:hypothetical protein